MADTTLEAESAFNNSRDAFDFALATFLGAEAAVDQFARDASDDVVDQLAERMFVAERALMATPAYDGRGLIAKLQILFERGCVPHKEQCAAILVEAGRLMAA